VKLSRYVEPHYSVFPVSHRRCCHSANDIDVSSTKSQTFQTPYYYLLASLLSRRHYFICWRRMLVLSSLTTWYSVFLDKLLLTWSRNPFVFWDTKINCSVHISLPYPEPVEYSSQTNNIFSEINVHTVW